MIHWNPDSELVTNGLAFGVTAKGHFDFENLTGVIEPPSIGQIDPLDEIRSIHLEAERYHVMIQLFQREILTFDQTNPTGPLSTVGKEATKDFFRFGTNPQNGKIMFADVSAIAETTKYHTSELFYMLKLIPDDQLFRLGIESLRRIIK